MNIAKNINQKNFEIIICASPEGVFKKEVAKRGFAFKDIFLPKLYRRKYLKNLDEIVKSEKIDIIHSHGGVAGMYARFYRKNFKSVKIIHSIHGIHYINSKNPFRNLVSKSIEQFLVPYTDIFVCASQNDFDTADKIKIISKEKTKLIRYGINIPVEEHIRIDLSLAEKLGIKETDFVIGNVSRFDYQKNQRLIIKIAPEIIKSNDNVKFLFVGDGRYLNSCKEKCRKLGISEKVIFTGEVTDVARYYPLIDIFVFPSLWEGLSLTLLETMAFSKCIIASDIPSNKEVIKNSQNGMLFDLNNHEQLIRLVLSLIANPDERKRLSHKAREDSLQFDMASMVRKIENCYRKVMEENQ